MESRPDYVNVHDAKTNLSKLLARVEAGEEIVLARAGRPVARIVPMTQLGPSSIFGALAGEPGSSDAQIEALMERDLEIEALFGLGE